MSREPVGRHLPLSLSRRMMCDLLHFGKQVPTVPVQRQMNLAGLRAARDAALVRVSWTVLFTKAYALLARDLAVLRQAYLTFPWERIYEHPVSNPYISIEADYRGEKVVSGLILRAPENAPLDELNGHLENFRTRPIESCGRFRKSLLITRLPRFLRRWLWWYALNVSGAKKAKYLGTFGVSVYSALGAESLHPIVPLTTTLNYGVIAPDGSVPVRIIYDHRLMDGATVARALGQLEEILTGPIVRELAAARPVAA
jgi:hypothetical protein